LHLLHLTNVATCGCRWPSALTQLRRVVPWFLRPSWSAEPGLENA